MKLISFIAILASSCSSGGGGSSTPSTTCGTGTHNNGSGTCVVDNAIAIQNTTSNYWSCSSFGNIQFLSGGTGKYNFFQTDQTISWNETVGYTDNITFSSGTHNFTYTSITPNSLVNPVSFTANENGNNPTSCSLINAPFP